MIRNRPILLDVTRLIACGWSGRQPTGIDRVCDAYLNHYRHRAHAAFQHRGVVRVLNETHSNEMFSLMAERDRSFKSRLFRLAPSMLKNSVSTVYGPEHLYLNLSQTDADLASHWDWIRRCKLTSVQMVHDLIPILNPNYCTPEATRRHTGRVTNALRYAGGVITNSHATNDDLVSFASDKGIPLPPILTAHLGVSDVIGQAAGQQDQSEHFVFVGTFEARKNHQMLFRIWRRFIASGRPDVPLLVLIGQRSSLFRSIELELKSDRILAAKVKILTDCGDEEMSRWVRTARAALIPSLDEGFGLPLVEAMTLGVPSIVSDLPSFREIGDSIPEFIPADDECLWEAAIIKFFESETQGNRQRLRLAAYKPSPWRQHFGLVDEWLSRLPRQHTASASGNLGAVLEDGGTTPSASTEFAHRKVA